MPISEFETYHQSLLEKYYLCLTFLITPTTLPDRKAKIDKVTTGFIYVVSSNSITGKTSDFESSIDAYLNRIGNMALTSKKIVGFGIHNKQSFESATSHTDGAILGSAFLKSLSQQPTQKEIAQFIQNIKN